MAPRPAVQPPVCVPLCALCYREEALGFHAFLALLRWLLCLECSPLPYPVSPDLILYLNALPGLNAGRRVSDEGCSLFLEAKMVISSYSQAFNYSNRTPATRRVSPGDSECTSSNPHTG